MKFSYKHILLIIIILEIAFGSFFLINSYRKNKNSITSNLVANKINGVTKIKKSSLVPKADDQHRYYYELDKQQIIKQQTEWMSHEAVYTHNQDGLNDTQDYSIEKEVNTFRIITLGDSFTYGQFVNTEDSWPEKLETMLNKLDPDQNFEVINLGMAGFDIPYLVKRYQEIGAKYNPDLVVWLESGSGFMRFRELMQPQINECLYSEAKNEENDSIYLDCWREAKNKTLQNHSRADLNSLLTASLENFFSSIDSARVLYVTLGTDLTEEELSLLKQWSQLFPEAHFHLGLTQLNSEQRLFDGHPNQKGHTQIAQEIMTLLIESNFLEFN